MMLQGIYVSVVCACDPGGHLDSGAVGLSLLRAGRPLGHSVCLSRSQRLSLAVSDHRHDGHGRQRHLADPHRERRERVLDR